MSDTRTLTQVEVDALLGAFTAPPSPGAPVPDARPPVSRPVKNYDFRRPDKFSKEQLRSLQLLHDNFARLLGSNLTSYLRGTTAVHLMSVEQTTYREYSEQLPRPTVLYLLGLEPLPGHAIFEVNLPVAFAIIDRLLGGPGAATTIRPNRQNGELSEIETSLIQGVGTQLLGALKDAWSDIVMLSPRLQDIAFSAELIQASLPNEICVLATLEIKVMNSAGTLSLCLPYTLLEPIVSRLSAQALVAGSFRKSRRQDPLAQQRTLRQLEKVMLPVSVQLGTASVTINELLTLEAGDIIRLDTPASSPLTLCVDGRPRYRVRPGLAGARLAVRIEEVLPPEPAEPAADDTQRATHEQGMEGRHEQPVTP